uniref:C-type lectin domain-containing protein n=1 Tax=Caenorhabditis japonica TaxID=281687 RepID=A0A8R1IXE1_CAEJA
MWIWLDGRSEDRPKEFAMEDDTHGGTSSYMWYTNRPSANKTDYCIYMLYNELYVDDEACNKSERFRGGVCRIRIDNADHA